MAWICFGFAVDNVEYDFECLRIVLGEPAIVPSILAGFLDGLFPALAVYDHTLPSHSEKFARSLILLADLVDELVDGNWRWESTAIWNYGPVAGHCG